jgi:hypothetical protein
LQSAITARSPTNLAAPDTPESIVGSVFIHLGESGIIKTDIDEKIRFLTQQKSGESSVNEVCCLLTDAVNTNEAHILGAEEEL